ncbi:PQQ-dependent sugar dehydrogenase [Gallaecimonas sp. GXIMD4217]|uniref:PQQ-dependent sugar dehydrogenase n=1 Tax=Gallaecimonas sp. GXIMD4217 TaxID=3131927 RepID=UPI00311ADD1D
MRLLFALCLLCLSAQAETLKTDLTSLEVETLAERLEHPWALAFLPGGELLISERPGRLRRLSGGKLGPPIRGLPEISAVGQGGLLDLLFHDGWLYFSYAEPGKLGNSTAVARARLQGDRLVQRQLIFRQQPKVASSLHFGSRLAMAPSGHLFITLGERFHQMDDAQSLDNHHGKIVRLWPDGRIPKDNPFVGREGALAGIWSYGHRNSQGAAIHPDTGELWIHEHGPQGGDELNRPQPGRNYGWPVITYGEQYGGGKIGIGTHKAGMEQPLYQWTPSIAPSGMVFYRGDAIPAWQGDLLLGSLKFGLITRLRLDGTQVLAEERIALGARVRDLRQGPDGALYVLTDQRNGRLLRLTAK